MALYYHLANVYKVSESKKDAVEGYVENFVENIPKIIKKNATNIEDKNYKNVEKYSNQLIDYFEMFGMDLALEDVYQIKKWCQNKGKRKEIAEIFKSLENHTSLAIKELKKDFKKVICKQQL